MKILSQISKIVPFIFLLFGLIIFCYPMFLDFNRMPGDYEDARFINYILEHGYLYLKNTPTHQDFWTLPMHYPKTNTLAYSDVMLGGMLIYIPLRFVFDNPQTAFQIFFVLVNIANFFIFYYFSKNIFKFNTVLSSFVAYFYSFNLIRHIHTIHIQLFLQFFMIAFLFCLFKVNKNNTKFKNNILLFFGLLFFVLQAYSAFYFTWFMCFSILIILPIILFSSELRLKIKDWFLSFNIYSIFITLFSLCLMFPLIYHYLSTGNSFNKAQVPNLLHFLISDSLIDSFLFVPNQYYVEFMLGVGVFTTILLLIAVLKSKYKFQLISFFALFLLVFLEPHIYSMLYKHFPPMIAVRAIGRMVFLFIPIYAILLGFYLKNLKASFLTFVFGFLVILEQIPDVQYYNWTKTGHEKRISSINLPVECNVIMLDIPNENHINRVEYNLNAMWYALKHNKFSVNGYSAFYDKNDKNILPKQCVANVK